MYETLLVNGVDLTTIVSCISSLDGLYNIGTPRGDNIVFPGVDGETYTDKAFATGLIELGLFVKGDTTTLFNDGLRALRVLIQPGQKLALARRLSYTSGNETHYAAGEFQAGLNPSLQLLRFGRTTVALKILDGIWYAGSTTSLSVFGGASVTVLGETRTQKMTIVMAPSTTVTNTTTGHTVTNTVLSGGNVTVDVLQMTATQNGVDVSNSLVWTRRVPMRLAPGVNTFTGDSATIIYYPAYL